MEIIFHLSTLIAFLAGLFASLGFAVIGGFGNKLGESIYNRFFSKWFKPKDYKKRKAKLRRNAVNTKK
jgi:hypothetical protein